MNEITSYNIEAWLLDYVEGNLNDNQIIMLMDFLEKNPEFAGYIEEYENVTLTADNIVFNEKESLKKKDYERGLAFDEKCIAYHEGLLNASDRMALESEIQDDTFKSNIFSLYQKAKLIPDLNIVYPHKEQLKKNPFSHRIGIYLSYAAAASVLLFAGVYITEHYNKTQIDNPVVANVENTSPLQSSVQKSINYQSVSENKPVVKKRKARIQKTSQSGNIAAVAESQENKSVDDNLENYQGISLIDKVVVRSDAQPLTALVPIAPRKVDNDDASAENYIPIDELAIKTVNNFYKKAVEQIENERKWFTTYNIASLIIKKINKSTGSEITIEKKDIPDSDYATLAVESKYFGFQTVVKK
jgi:hypothetical protein